MDHVEMKSISLKELKLEVARILQVDPSVFDGMRTKRKVLATSCEFVLDLSRKLAESKKLL